MSDKRGGREGEKEKARRMERGRQGSLCMYIGVFLLNVISPVSMCVQREVGSDGWLGT